MTERKLSLFIIGAGLVGASAAYHASEMARKGELDIEITLFEHAPEGVQRGGSGDEGRITRTNTHEDQAFRDLVPPSNRLLLELGTVTPADAVIVGNLETAIASARKSAANNRVGHTLLSAYGLKDTFPLMNPAGFNGVNEWAMDKNGEGSGVLDPRRTIEALIARARENGATIRFDTSVATITEEAGKCIVTTAGGETLTADKVITAAGPWTGPLLPKDSPAASEVRPKVSPVYLFKVNPGKVESLEKFPAVMLKIQGGEEFAAQHPGFVAEYPDFRDATATRQIYLMKQQGQDENTYIKVGVFVPSEKDVRNVDTLLAKAEVPEGAEKVAADMLKYFLPGLVEAAPSIAAGKADRIRFCPIDETKDDLPIVAPLRSGSNIVVVTGLSGVGAKVAPELGRFGVLHALGRSHDIPEAARNAFAIDRSALLPKPALQANGTLYVADAPASAPHLTR